MKGAVVPGGAERNWVCDTPAICAHDSSSLTFGWKKYFTTEEPLRFWDSVCSASLTMVCAVRSLCSTRRVAIASGVRPVYRQMVATAWSLMFRDMAGGVL